jgi:AcrR family transcriptional regulator
MRAQGRRTRAKLLGAGADVLAERGYRATRVDDIVSRARTSHGTFYQYFASKDELVHALAQAAVDDMSALAGDLGEVTGDAAGRAELRRFIGAFYDVYGRHGAVMRAWAENQIDDRALHRIGQRSFATMTATVADRIRSARHAPVTDPDLAATLVLATIERLVYFVTSRPLGLPVDELLDELAGALHRGFFGATAGAPRRRATSGRQRGRGGGAVTQRRAARSTKS